jgi:hypothetical protein
MNCLFFLLVLPTVEYHMEAGQMDLVWRRGERIMQMSGGVTITTEDAVITSNRGEYSDRSKIALLVDSVVMTGDDFEVLSDTLEYGTETDRMEFRGRVRAEDEKRFLETDTLEVIAELGTLRGRIRLTFKESDACFTGAEGEYDMDREEGRLFGRPEALIRKGDTLRVLADVFRFRKDSVFGGPDVRFSMGESEGGGDSLLYLEERGTLSGTAWMAWDGGTAQSESLRFEIEEGRMREMEFFGDVELTHESEDGTMTLYSPYMRARVLEGELESLEVFELEQGTYAESEDEER